MLLKLLLNLLLKLSNATEIKSSLKLESRLVVCTMHISCLFAVFALQFSIKLIYRFRNGDESLPIFGHIWVVPATLTANIDHNSALNYADNFPVLFGRSCELFLRFLILFMAGRSATTRGNICENLHVWSFKCREVTCKNNKRDGRPL